MLIEFGNPNAHENRGEGLVPLPHGEPAVTYYQIPNEYSHVDGADARDLALHLAQNPDVTRLPDHEAFVSVVRSWPHHSPDRPAWVWSDNDDMERLLAEFFDCPRGRPDNVEDTHHTHSGPPGSGPESE